MYYHASYRVKLFTFLRENDYDMTSHQSDGEESVVILNFAIISNWTKTI